MNCPFCDIKKLNIIAENELVYAIYDRYPVNEGHTLIISKRHFANFFEATKEEKQAILDLIEICKEKLDKKFNPDGYNIGINIGKASGQTIMHLHVHLIPRYEGDIENPAGGVRGVIPEKRIY